MPITSSMNTMETTTHTGMFLIRNADGTDMALVSSYTDDATERGLWVWFGLVYDGTAEPIVPGLVIREWNLLDGDGRRDYVVTKVNRVTITVRAMGAPAGDTKSIRIDR